MSGSVFNPNKVIVYGTIIQDDKKPLQAQMEFDTNDVVIESEYTYYGGKSVKVKFSSSNETLIIPEKAEVVSSEEWEISW